MLEGCFVLCELVHESIKEPTTKGFTLLKIIIKYLRMCCRTRT